MKKMIKKFINIFSWTISAFVFYIVFELLFDRPTNNYVALSAGTFLCYFIAWISFKTSEFLLESLTD